MKKELSLEAKQLLYFLTGIVAEYCRDKLYDMNTVNLDERWAIHYHMVMRNLVNYNEFIDIYSILQELQDFGYCISWHPFKWMNALNISIEQEKFIPNREPFFFIAKKEAV